LEKLLHLKQQGVTAHQEPNRIEGSSSSSVQRAPICRNKRRVRTSRYAITPSSKLSSYTRAFNHVTQGGFTTVRRVIAYRKRPISGRIDLPACTYRKRNSVRFSIIDDEWPQVRSRLEAKLANLNAG